MLLEGHPISSPAMGPCLRKGILYPYFLSAHASRRVSDILGSYGPRPFHGYPIFSSSMGPYLSKGILYAPPTHGPTPFLLGNRYNWAHVSQTPSKGQMVPLS